MKPMGPDAESKMQIAVTGLGCVTPCGNSASELWDALLQGKSGVARITHFPTERFSVDIAGELKGFDPLSTGVTKKEARRLTHYVLWGLASAQEAIAQAGLDTDSIPSERIGSIMGVGMGALGPMEKEVLVLHKRGPSRVSPLLVPSGTPEVPPSEIARRYGFHGPSFSVSTACSSGSDAVIAALRCIQAGEVDVVIAGGADQTVSELGLATFANLGALARRNGDPTTACRPFDRGRTGFVMGEGAGALVLESVEHAKKRGAEILAVVSGYGQTTDAFHNTAPDPSGVQAARALRLALERSGLQPEDVSYINAHGTSTQQNDPTETRAIKTALGEAAYKVPVSSTKSMTGHMIGAAGAVEAIVAVQAIRYNAIPPTINYQDPDPECDLFYVPNEAIDAPVEAAMSNSFGFGGHNSSLLFRSAKSVQ